MTEKTKAPAKSAPATADGVDWAMLTSVIPDASDMAASNIVQSILDAQTPEEMNQGTGAEGLRDLDNHVIRVAKVCKAESRVGEGPSHFLIMYGTDLDGGRDVVVTTSAEQPMAMLIKCHVSDWLPADFRVSVSKVPTRSGFHPINLEYLGQPL